MAAAVPSSDMSPGGSSRIMEQAVDAVKPWDQFFQTEPPLLDQSALEDGWSLLHEGRLLEDGLVASAAELVSDLLWGNLALPINKCLDKLRRIDALLCDDAPADMSYLAEMSARIERSVTGEPAAGATDGLSDDQRQEEALLRRECRELLELSTAQLEEMHEKKGEFGQAYRVVAAAWYMMMLPSTTLRSPLIAPDDASKAAWDAMEKEYERRRVEGTRWRTAREDETVFDDEAARRHPYEMTQTRRRHELTITVPVPARTRACDVRVSLQKRQLRITVATHPLSPVVAGELYSAIRASESGGDWHLEGEFETRRLVLDLDKESLADWPCLLLADAPEEPEREKKPVLSGAAGEANVYDETVLQRPERSDRFFSWGDAPQPAGDGGARSLRGMVPSKGGGLPPTVEQAEAHRRAEQGMSEETSLSRE